MSPGEAAVIMFGTFAVLVLLRIPVSFALGLACVPMMLIDDRLTPMMLMNEMWKSYNSFILLAVPFFLLAANDESNQTDSSHSLIGLLEKDLSRFGFDADLTATRMAGFQSVQNTYLTTFQSLGGRSIRRALHAQCGDHVVQIRGVLCASISSTTSSARS